MKCHFIVMSKVLFCGPPGVGKTSIIYTKQNCQGCDTETTYQATYYPITVEDVEMCVFDTPGQDEYFQITKSIFNRIDAIVYVFDLNDSNSLDKVDKYYDRCKNDSQESLSFLVGNKSDLDREVPTEKGKEKAQSLHAEYIETSAQNGDNIDELFNMVALKIKESPHSRCEPHGIDIHQSDKNNDKKSQCC